MSRYKLFHFGIFCIGIYLCSEATTMEKTIYTKAYKKLLEKLRAAREEAGMNQGDAAKKLKCSQSYVSKAENGHLRLDVIQLKEFADLYNKKITHFIDL